MTVPDGSGVDRGRRPAPAGDAFCLGRWLADRALITPTRTALEFGADRWTYAELDVLADQVAGALADRGLRAGDRVAVLAGNCPEYVAVFFAAARAGLLLVPLNWRLTPVELAYQLDDADVALLAHDRACRELAAAAQDRAGRARPAVDVAELTGSAAAWGGPAQPVRDDDPLLLVYTSGTTGRPKGALLTHANCFWTNLSLDRTSEVHSTDVVLQVLPQFHVGGWNVQPLLAWWKGATVVLEPSFEPKRVLELIAQRRITTMMGVPATYLFIAQQPQFADADLSSLRYVLVGGSPMPESLLQTWQRRGVQIIQGYGLTEAAPNVLCLPAEDAARKLGFAGKPYAHVDVSLGDPASGRLLSGPATGELLVRGPNVFAGYWRNPSATADALRAGWLHTGDIAERDDEGFYRIRDRLKDVYQSGGENVYPAEVEAVLHAHPAVAEAAVVAVPDERWGEAGLAVVSVRAGMSTSSDELLGHCRERLARFKVPREVRFVDALPRSGMNKVLKARLRELICEST